MKSVQTPQKDQSRQSDLSNRRSKETQLKKSQKILPKSLNAEFTTVSEDSSPEKMAKELLDFSPISELFESVTLHFIRAVESLGFTPSSTITFTKTDVTNLSLDRNKVFKSNGSVEADVLVNLLKEARSQVVNSADVNFKNKKLLDSLIKFVVEEFYSFPQESDRVVELVSMKCRIMFMCFLICSLAVSSVILFFNSELQRAFIGPLPT